MVTFLRWAAGLAATLITWPCLAQIKNSDVEQDPKMEAFVNEKRKLQSSITITDKYKVQLYSGDMESARKILTDFKKDFKSTDATLTFQSPAYKVWVGTYSTRIEAEMALKNIVKKFPKAFIFRPNKA